MDIKKLNILSYRWHIGHQYELWKPWHSVTLVCKSGTAMCDSWDYSQRPLPQNVKFKNFEDIHPQKYDLAILHFDENVLHPELCNGKESLDWGETFKNMLSLTEGMVRIAVCHGTPQFIGQYVPDFRPSTRVQIYDNSRKELVALLGNTCVVCNSYQAEKEWGFNNSTTIWHGFNPEEFSFGTHGKECLAPLLSSLEKRAYYMGFLELKKIIAILEGKVQIDFTETPNPSGNFTSIQNWAIAKYENYRNMLGTYSFYLNTTIRSPMPRSRGEAMMCGVIPLSFANHDVEMFIKNGINGYMSDEVGELADFALFLNRNTKVKEDISKAARETAIQYFNLSLFHRNWFELIKKISN